jgi:hypothetical protein
MCLYVRPFIRVENSAPITRIFMKLDIIVFIIIIIISSSSSSSSGSKSISIIFSGSAAQRGLWPPRSLGFLITHNDAPQSVGLLWTNDQLIAETST